MRRSARRPGRPAGLANLSAPVPGRGPASAEEATPPEAEEEETPAFGAEVEIVTVDVVVVDRKGRAVPGFQRSDFSLYENGEPQAITKFESVEMPPLPT